MEILLLLLLVFLVILLTALSKGLLKSKFFVFLVMLISASASIYIIAVQGKFDSTGLISSFLSGSTIKSPDLLASSYENNSLYKWRSFNSQLADINYGNNSVSIRPLGKSRWVMNNNGPMVYLTAEGDFFFSAMIKRNDFPDTTKNGEHFGGIIVRSPSADGIEDNILIAVGYCDKEFKIEVKSTDEGNTSGVSAEWLSGDAELMIQREAAVFGMYARPYGTEIPWRKVQTLHRPDFTGLVTVGVMTYSDSSINDVLYFNDIKFRKISQ